MLFTIEQMWLLTLRGLKKIASQPLLVTRARHPGVNESSFLANLFPELIFPLLLSGNKKSRFTTEPLI